MRFDRFVMVDWSGGNDRGPRPKKDAIWACSASDGQVETPPVLRQVSRCQVYGDAPVRPVKMTVEQGAAHALLALAHRRLRQADDIKGR